jgi:spermidine/putrescine transport system permease protein
MPRSEAPGVQPKTPGGDPGLMILPAALAFAIFLAAPLGIFLLNSFLTAKLFAVAAPLTLDAYRRALTTPLNGDLAVNSVLIGLLGATASLMVAMPVAYWLRFHAGRLALPLLFIITATMFASYLVRIYAWRTILGGNGIINRSLIAAGLIEEPAGFLLYNWFSVTVALVHIFLPYVILILYAGFRPIEPALLEAAQDLGANAPQRWRRVVLPVIAGPATTAFLFVFVLAASDYVTPQLIGGTGGQMLGVQIQSNFKAIGDWPQGAALSVLLVLALFACCAAVWLAIGRKRTMSLRWSA